MGKKKKVERPVAPKNEYEMLNDLKFIKNGKEKKIAKQAQDGHKK